MRLTHSILALLLLAGRPLLAAAEPRPRLDAYGDPLPSGAVARLGTVRFRTAGTVLAVALSPDGRIAASLDDYGPTMLCLWDSGTGRLLYRRPAQDVARALAFSPDGKLLATAGRGEEVWLWDTTAARVLRRSRSGDSDDDFSDICFCPDGKLLATVGHHGVCIWEPATGKVLRRCWLKQTTHSTLAFSLDGKTLASAGDEKGICLWEVATGKLLGQCRKGTTVYSLALSGDGKTLASRSDEEVCLWQGLTGKLIRRYPIARPFWGLAFSADGKVLAGINGAAIDLRKAASGKKVVSCRGHLRHVRSLSFSPDGKRLLSGSEDGTLQMWDTATGKPLRHEVGHGAKVRALAFSFDGRTLASGGEDGTLRLWDVGSGRQLCQRADHADYVRSVSFAPDGKRLASAGSNPPPLDKDAWWSLGLRVWDVTPERLLRPLWVNDQCVAEQAVFSLDGKMVAAATNRPRGHICVYDAHSGKELRRWQAHSDEAEGLCYSPDGRTLATVGDDGALCFWEAANERRHRVCHRTGDRFESILSSPDGRTWACVGSTWRPMQPGSERMTDLWDAPSGKHLRRFVEERALAFSPDGLLLATAAEGGGLRLREAATGKEVLGWPGHGEREVKAAVFSPDGKLLASAGQDSAILLWDVGLLLHGRKLVPARLRDQELTALWQALAGSDVRQAYQAIDVLAASPKQVVPFLQPRLQPVTLDMQQVERLLAELDSDDFNARERASRQLAALSEAAEPLLEQTLAAESSAEVRRRVKQLLAGIERQTWSAGQLRQLRCLAVLERASTLEARQLLHALAKGAEGSRLTQAACAALRRLDRRTSESSVRPQR